MCGGQTATGEEEVSEVKHEPRGPLHAVCREPTGVKRPHSGSFQAQGPGGGTRRRPFSSIDSSLEEETHKVATKEHSRRTGGSDAFLGPKCPKRTRPGHGKCQKGPQ